MTRTRVRGIYATALTERLRSAVEIVQPSAPIDRRFDASFPITDHDVSIATTDDRVGVGVVGDPDGVETVREGLDVGIDTFSWRDDAPRGAVFRGTVTEELGRGAVVDLGPREAYLRYDAVDDHVTEGDPVRVQVHEPAPPWSDRRPEVGGEVVVYGGLADLVSGRTTHEADVPDPERAGDLRRLVDVLPASVPDGWAVRWDRAAARADVDALGDALDRVVTRADSIDPTDPPVWDAAGPDADPESPRLADGGAWVWFGRESRAALDDVRREVTATLPGHHRIKATSSAASAAVDFTEAVCDPADPVPFDVLARHFGPTVGDAVRIEHGKPDGRWPTLGRATVTDRSEDTVTVTREMSPGGTYDALGIPREAGDTATTRFEEGRWWYPTVYRSDAGDPKGTYVNVCTPVEVYPDAVRYVDLHVDVIRHADGTVERVDDDELEDAEARGAVTAALATKAREVASAVERGLS